MSYWFFKPQSVTLIIEQGMYKDVYIKFAIVMSRRNIYSDQQRVDMMELVQTCK